MTRTGQDLNPADPMYLVDQRRDVPMSLGEKVVLSIEQGHISNPSR